MPATPPLNDPMTRALALMQEALRLLDEGSAPAHIGAHLDLAIVRLEEEQAPADPANAWSDGLHDNFASRPSA